MKIIWLFGTLAEHTSQLKWRFIAKNEIFRWLLFLVDWHHTYKLAILASTKSWKTRYQRLSTIGNKVEYTKGGNPRPPKPELVNEWVKEAWNATSQENINKSIRSAGFAFKYKDWHISKHDIYGEKFCQKWEEENGKGVKETDSSLTEEEDDFFVIENDESE